MHFVQFTDIFVCCELSVGATLVDYDFQQDRFRCCLSVLVLCRLLVFSVAWLLRSRRTLTAARLGHGLLVV